MEKVEDSIENNYYDLGSLELDFDEVARKKIKEKIERNPLANGMTQEENELLLFLLCLSIFS